MEEAAVLSKSAYDYFREGIEFTDSELSAYGLEGYKVDEDLSDNYSVVITRPYGSAVVSYRGTDALEDFVPDLQILLGRHSPFVERFALHRHVLTDRFERASQKFEKTAAKHSVAYTTGHSLGGSQALSMARKHQVTSHTFNPGSSPLVEMIHAGVCSMADCGELPQTIYSTGLDPISIGSYLFDRVTDKVVTVPKKHGDDWMSHSLSHFLPERKASTPEPVFLQPVRVSTGERKPFCQAFPELCKNKF